MKKLTLFALSLITFLSFSVASSYSAVITVDMKDFAFDPPIVHINPGDTVKWENKTTTGVQHTSTSGTGCTPDGIWDSGFLNPNQTFERVFDTAGTFPYICTPHCLIGMVGTVVVGSQPTQNQTLFSGPASFSIKFTSTTPPDATGNQKFTSTTQPFTGTIKLIFKGDSLLADEEGCFVKFSGDDGTTFCALDASFIRTFSTRSTTDQLLLVGAGDSSRPVTGGNKTGPFFINSKGSLKKSSGAVVSISLNGSIGGGASDGEFVFSANFRATLTPVQNVVVITTTLSGDQEVPPVVTTGSGNAVFIITNTGAISGRVDFTGLSGNATAAHIHQGAAGVPGPVIIPLEGGLGVTAGEWTVPAGTVLTTDQLTALVAHLLYVNIHTGNNPGGEIRGQIIFPPGSNDACPGCWDY
ncbi:MAG TPA: CHRD domain-containing protein [Thermodesulfobacteriota bacterium]|nr:CHRD domain-containing protein [Thermodesulfobacteriota bacterium]